MVPTLKALPQCGDPPGRATLPKADPCAFAEVYDSHVRFVWRSLRRLGVRPAELEDACQEAFLVVHRKFSTYDPSRPMRAWIFGICMRVAAGYRRRAHVRFETSDASLPEPMVHGEQPEELAKQRAHRMLDTILEGLDDRQRAVFVLYEFEQLSMSEVAATVMCPIQTAYSRLHAARKRVEEAIRRLQEGAS